MKIGQPLPTNFWKRSQRMANWVKRNVAGLLALAIGLSFLLYGIHRQEHQTVAKKSNIICLECIGIG